MRKLMLVALALAVVAPAGLAVAHGLGGSRSARALAGTFTATTASSVTSRTCTSTDGKTIVTTTGTYRGTAAGDADLAGPIAIGARSVINTTDGVGVVEVIRIDVASGRDTTARFSAVYTGGRLAGLATGQAHEPSVALLANLSAGFTTAGGFTDGKLGNSAGGGAVALAGIRCQAAPKPKPERSDARGTVSAVSSTSITVSGLTCAVPAALASKVAAFKVGDRAEIHCTHVAGQTTLDRITKKR